MLFLYEKGIIFALLSVQGTSKIAQTGRSFEKCNYRFKESNFCFYTSMMSLSMLKHCTVKVATETQKSLED